MKECGDEKTVPISDSAGATKITGFTKPRIMVLQHPAGYQTSCLQLHETTPSQDRS